MWVVRIADSIPADVIEVTKEISGNIKPGKDVAVSALASTGSSVASPDTPMDVNERQADHIRGMLWSMPSGHTVLAQGVR